MKYTKEQLQGISDLEVSKLLANILGVMWHLRPGEFRNRWSYCDNYEGLDGVNLPDYCNNPSDIMPLAFEHGISLITVDKSKSWFAECNSEVNDDFIMCSKVSFPDSGPLRAIACCLILVLQDRE